MPSRRGRLHDVPGREVGGERVKGVLAALVEQAGHVRPGQNRGLYCRVRNRSKALDTKRRARIHCERRMTPEQRLDAHVEHSRLVMEFYHAGVRDRRAAARVRSAKR